MVLQPVGPVSLLTAPLSRLTCTPPSCLFLTVSPLHLLPVCLAVTLNYYIFACYFLSFSITTCMSQWFSCCLLPSTCLSLCLCIMPASQPACLSPGLSPCLSLNLSAHSLEFKGLVHSPPVALPAYLLSYMFSPCLSLSLWPAVKTLTEEKSCCFCFQPVYLQCCCLLSGRSPYISTCFASLLPIKSLSNADSWWTSRSVSQKCDIFPFTSATLSVTCMDLWKSCSCALAMLTTHV